MGLIGLVTGVGSGWGSRRLTEGAKGRSLPGHGENGLHLGTPPWKLGDPPSQCISRGRGTCVAGCLPGAAGPNEAASWGRPSPPKQLTRRDPDRGDREEQTFRDLPRSLFPARPPDGPGHLHRRFGPRRRLHVPGLEGRGGVRRELASQVFGTTTLIPSWWRACWRGLTGRGADEGW